MAKSLKVKLLVASFSLNILPFSEEDKGEPKKANTKDKQIQEELEITGLNLQVECGSSTNQTNQMISVQ